MKREDPITMANKILPTLNQIAAEVIDFLADKRVADLPWENPTEDATERADYMVRTYLLIQYEHLRSTLVLVETGHDRDSSIIARTMAEGLTQLYWALKDEPKRTDQWFWYETILERLQLFENQENGREVLDEEREISDKLIAEHWSDYYNKETRTAHSTGEPPAEDERRRYRDRWHKPTIAQLFQGVEENERNLKYWRSASGWTHWSPITVFRAMDQGGGPIRYAMSDTREAVRALIVAINCALNTLLIAAYRFKLPYAERIDGYCARLSEVRMSDSSCHNPLQQGEPP